MSPFAGVVWCEWLKLRRSALTPISLAVAILIPLVVGLFMKVLVDPTWADRLGLVALKAEASGTPADWAGYLSIVTQAIAVGGLIVFGLVEIWIFGREASDGTMKDLLAVPVSRTAIVGAKFLVAGLWCSLLAGIVFVVAVGAGGVIGIPGWSRTLFVDGLVGYFAVAALTVMLVTAFGLAACLGRGYLPAVAVLFASLFAGQVLAALGFGAWFPWSIPALMSGMAGPAGGAIGTASHLIVGGTALAAVGWTVAWWHRADHA